MKIGLMTWFTYKNYGTFLQATALISILEKLDNKVELINYDPTLFDRSEYETKVKKKFTKRIMGKLNYWAGNYNQVECFSGLKFEEYTKNMMPIGKPCQTDDELKELENRFDAIICGSDQIWSPLCFDLHYYLDFVDKEKKIAYAPSIGVSKIENESVKRKVKELLDDFKYISIRESDGQKIIKELTNKSVPVVVDPTLLLNAQEWNELFKIKENSGEYILVYFLGDNKTSWKIVENFSKRENMSCKIIPVYPKDLNRIGALQGNVGPKEFVELIQNAKYVCTDSFHGMIFSIIYKKLFICFQRFSYNDKGSQNSRIFSIMKKLGLQHRLYSGDKIDKYLEPIDYLGVYDKLESWREESYKYLTESINSISSKLE